MSELYDQPNDQAGQSMRIESRIVPPVTSNSVANGRVRFLAPTSGLLLEDSYIRLQVKTADNNHFQLGHAGVLSLIRDATLRVGNTEICSLHEGRNLLAMKRDLYSIDERSRKDAVKYGVFLDAWFQSKNTTAGAGSRAGKLALDGNVKGVQYAPNGGADEVSAVVEDSVRWRPNDSTPEHIIPLRLLFPAFLSKTRIPLGLLNERLSLEILWADDSEGSRALCKQGENFITGTQVIAESIKWCVDLAYYDDPEGERMGIMEAMEDEMNGKGLDFEYTDIITNQTTIPAASVPVDGTGAPVAPFTGVEKTTRLIGFANESVRNIFFAYPQNPNVANAVAQGQNYYTGGGNVLMGQVHSQASMGSQELQVRVNNRPLYPIPVGVHGGDANLFDGCSQVYNTPLHLGEHQFSNKSSTVNNRDYSSDQIAITDKTMEGYKQDNVNGKFQYMGCYMAKTRSNDAGSGMLVGKSPVEIEINRQRSGNTTASGENKPGDFQVLRLYSYAECERKFTLKDGDVFISQL